LDPIKRPADAILSVVDRHGVVVAREPGGSFYVGPAVVPKVRQLLDRPQSGPAIAPSCKSRERIVGFVPITVPPAGLYVSAGFLLEDLTADIDGARGTVI
jgi:hypothetical protein